jgi:MFS family permease
VGTTFAMTFGLLAAHQLFSDGFAVAFVIQAVTLRQTVLPKEVLGRANAAIHVCTSGLLPVAAVIAGGLAELFGTRTAVWIGVMVGLLSPLLLLPLRKLKEMPSSSDSSQELPLARSSTSKLPIVQLTE